MKKKLLGTAIVLLVLAIAAGAFVYFGLEWPTFGEVTFTLEQDAFPYGTVEIHATLHNGTNRELWYEGNRCQHRNVERWNGQDWQGVILCDSYYFAHSIQIFVAQGEEHIIRFEIVDIRDVDFREIEGSNLIARDLQEGIALPPGRYRVWFDNVWLGRSIQPALYAEFEIV
ncbi:MAG: hypothetical protein FWE40_00640 [Oscillospiraceae bacterium]|nr:hypothetical protein [Oscillospiraceae bacterium]